MYLLDAETLTLKLFNNEVDRPEYAILSHTWLPDGEVSFKDIQDLDLARQKPGFSKIESTCRRALQDRHQYVWIDTCCIDKSSSSELTEAINSMYKWYEQSIVYYAYLADALDESLAQIVLQDGVEQCDDDAALLADTEKSALVQEKFLASRWITRQLAIYELCKQYARCY